MTYFKWTNELDIKVDKMNDQHKILISIMDELHQVSFQGESKQTILNKLNELNAFTKKHFKDEELYMDAIQFEERERHKIVHQHLLTELDGHIRTFKNGSNALGDDFFYFLKHWLSSHIKHIDIKYGNASVELNMARAI